MQSFYWTIGGVQQGDEIVPLSAFTTSPDSNGLQRLGLVNSTLDPLEYAGLYSEFNGVSNLIVPPAGVLGAAASLDVTSLFYPHGTFTFGFTDVTNGVTVSGQFQPIPEPATTGLIAAGLAAIGFARFRRAARKS